MAFLRLGESTNWPYAVARIQAKRSKLIPPGEYAKLLKMDVSEITRFMEESAYRTEVDELSSRFRGLDLLEAALTVNEERTHQAVRQMLNGPGRQLVSKYLMRYFVEDLKTVLRGKMAGASREDILKELLVEDMDTYNLFQPVLSDDVRTLDDVVAALDRQGGVARDWAKVLAAVPHDSALARYEDALDRAFYHRLLAEVKDSPSKGSALMYRFVRREVDVVNLVNAARWVAAGQTGDFSPYAVPGGRQFSVAQIMQLARSESLAAFADQLREAGMAEEVLAGMERAREAGRLVHFQTALAREHLRELDRLAHGNPLSIIPILVFLVRKHREVVLLRAVARGRAAGLSDERLQELIQ